MARKKEEEELAITEGPPDMVKLISVKDINKE